ncbi:MAG: thioredoxin-disulfide reductase [Holosporales bacterium]|jgi:thioredoxin reductase (NADPH)|nr:thioredoxin-disulfide reductase [Holosporales bacterium]
MIARNVIIIGSGPAGLTCAIYSARAGLDPIVIAGDNPGGQLVKTDIIENYPGFETISGADLMMKMLKHTESLGIEIIYETVDEISKTKEGFFEAKLSSHRSIVSKTIVIATGATHKRLGIPGEDEFSNRGVSWCATCDGPMCKGKEVAVIGGGNTAVMEAMFLSSFASHVYLIHRRDVLRAEKLTQEKLFLNQKISCVWNSSVVQILGGKSVEKIIIKNNIDGSIGNLEINGIFIAIGTTPSSNFVKNLLALDGEGYIVAEETKTSCDGIFAIGDVVSGSLKQAIYAAGQGALASKQVEKYVNYKL